MIEYEVGTRPSRPLTLLVRDELDNPVNIVGYDTLRLEVLDTDDKPLDLSGVLVQELGDEIGVVTVVWPKNRTIFDKKGKYVLRLVLEGNDGVKDITRTGEIRVRDFGRIK